MTSLLQAAAIDIGFGTSKISTDSSDITKIIEFASRANIVTSASSNNDILGLNTQSVIVPVKSKLYEVCTDQLNTDGLGGQILNDGYVDSDEYEAIFKAGLVTLNASHIEQLVLGLPMKSHASAEHRVENMATGRIDLGEHGSCEVKNVTVIRQGVGALQTYIYDMACSDRKRLDKLIKGSALIIDVGYRTIDWVRVDQRREVRNYSGSAPLGVSEILQEMAELIAQEHHVPQPTISQLNRAMREQDRTLAIHGERISLKPFRIQAMHIVDSAINTILNRVGDSNYLDAVILCGGGAGYIHDRLSKKLNCKIDIMRAPGTANVRGYLLLAQHMTAQP